MNCERCGTDMVPRARYCHQCGERALPGALRLDESQIADERPGWLRWRTAVLAVAGLAALLWLTKSLWLVADPVPPPRPTEQVDRSNAADPPPDREPVKPRQTAERWYGLRAAKLRSSMTIEADNIVGNVARGEEVKGSVEIGLDGKTSWLNTGADGPYVAVVNLAQTAPPPLDLVLDLSLPTVGSTTLYSTPGDQTGFSVATLPAGATVKISGVIDGWFEVLLQQGGVGYFKPADKPSKQAMAKALAVLDKSADDE